MKPLSLDPIDTGERRFNISKSTLIVISAIFAGVLALGIIYYFMFHVPAKFARTREGGVKTFAFTSSLITGATEQISANFPDSVLRFVEKGTGVVVNFTVENGNSLYQDTWSISQDSLNKLTQTQQWTGLFRKMLPDLISKINAYNQALAVKPFRVFAIAIDITSGYNGEFTLHKYLGDDGLRWLNDKTKASSIFIFSIGYTSSPGYISREDVRPEQINDIEREAKSFFASVSHKPMDSTKLLNQIHFIMGKMKNFTNPFLVIETDLRENSHLLSSYKQQSTPYKAFLSHANWDVVRENVVNESGTSPCPEATATVRIITPPLTAIGDPSNLHPWYTAMREYLAQTYPKVKFVYNFGCQVLPLHQPVRLSKRAGFFYKKNIYGYVLPVYIFFMLWVTLRAYLSVPSYFWIQVLVYIWHGYLFHQSQIFQRFICIFRFVRISVSLLLYWYFCCLVY